MEEIKLKDGQEVSKGMKKILILDKIVSIIILLFLIMAIYFSTFLRRDWTWSSSGVPMEIGLPLVIFALCIGPIMILVKNHILESAVKKESIELGILSIFSPVIILLLGIYTTYFCWWALTEIL